MNEPLAYLNGGLIPFHEARIPVYDRGVVMAATASEMTRTYRQVLFRLEDHLERLYASLGILGIDPGMSPNEMAALSRRLVVENARLLPPGGELGLTHFVTAGPSPLYAGPGLPSEARRPTVCLHTFPLDFCIYAGAMREGYHLVTPSVRHIPPECIPPGMKHRSRLHWYLADLETHRSDPRATSLLLDRDGYVTECTSANLLLVQRGAILSPPLSKVLGGISRKAALELATELGIPSHEQELRVSDVGAADEAFLSSTPFGLCPATRLNGQPIGDGRPGRIWRKLMEAWSDLVGLDAVAQVLAGDQG
ncbi:MAG: aminotransferase class IV [Planctomycetes bacterium]|nr:aminotransferase class IV [Planctomycetota bacterium]